MALDEDALRGVADDGQLDYDKWSAIVEPLLERLNHIVYHEFPMAQAYPAIGPAQNRPSSATETSAQQSAIRMTPSPSTPRQLPPVPPFPGSATTDTSISQIPNSQPEHGLPLVNDDDTVPEIPALLLQLLTSIIATIRGSFMDKPPHTIQRLSELILDPKKHYKTLPAWLRAVDRVVSVSSTADIFPLSDTPAIVNGVNGDGGGGILWNNSTDARNGSSFPESMKERDDSLGSDESLGGALLTPISWLRDISNDDSSGDLEGAGAGSDGQSAEDLLGEPIQMPSSTLDSPQTSATDSADAIHTPTSSTTESELSPKHATIHTSSDPFVPERPSGAVTQGELMRMEQEAGVIPVSPNGRGGASSPPSLGRSSLHSDSPPSSIALGVGIGLTGDPTTPRDLRALDQEDDDSADGLPHARGPDVVGTVDMGLVGGKGVEVRIGSPPAEHRLGMEKVDVNDAQDVLAGGNELKQRDQKPNKFHEEDTSGSNTAPLSSSDEFVHVSKEHVDDGDEMQVDEKSTDVESKTEIKDSGEDEDIVLVDADGATEEQRAKIDASDLNVGNDTADGTGL